MSGRASITSVRRLPVIGLLALGMFILAGCSDPADAPPATTPAPAEVKPRAAAPVAPQPPAEPTLPGGLAGSFGAIETRSGDGFRIQQTLLNRPELDGRRPVHVAVLVPLTGNAAAVGQRLLDAAMLALFDQRQPRLTLIPKDTQGTREGAEAAARIAIAEGAEMIVGPLFGDHVQIVRAVAAPAGVPVLAFSNDSAVAGNGAHILGITPANEVRSIINFALARGHSRIAAFLPDSVYGRRVHEALVDTMSTSVGELVRVTYYPAGAEADDELLLQYAREFADYDLRRQALEREKAKLASRSDRISKSALQRLEVLDTLGDPPFDAVLLAEPANRLPTIAPLLAFYDVDPIVVRYLGLGGWFADDLQSEPTLIGSWFPGPDPAFFNSFAERFQAAFGKPADRVAMLGYDAVAMAGALVRDQAPDAQLFSTEVLLNDQGFAAYYGAFRLRPSGLSERLLPILEVTREGLRVVGTPRDGFAPLLN
ncbi:MAG: penicillin-binding protein activator [Minwuia sp.]|nr:penicillin-binding protein activator [Minwuia sp.]